MPSPIRDHIHEEIRKELEKSRVVVWYDADRALESVFDTFQRTGVVKVDARASMLAARRQADDHWAVLTHPDPELRSCKAILVYVPWQRRQKEEERRREPFEAYARLGASFGDKPRDSLASLARAAMPGREAEVDRLVAERRKLTLEQLEALSDQAGYPLLKQALGTEDATDVGAQLIAAPERVLGKRSAAGVESDLLRLLHGAFGFDGAVARSDLPGAFARWVLFSEFALDVDGQVPSNVLGVPRADAKHTEAIYKLCDRLRGAEEWREAYFEVAARVEDELELGSIAADVSPWGKRDTFPAEDVAALRFVQAECMKGQLGSARETLDLRKRSIWLHEAERNQRWQLATRCLELLEAERRWRGRSMTIAQPPEGLVRAYTAAEDGLWRVDRCYRWMERAESSCMDKGMLEPLVNHVRAEYRRCVDGAQAVFLDVVARHGWPPGPLKQVQVFSRHVAPSLQDGGKVAYFLVDALRFEMGRDLGQMLEKLGAVQVEAATTVVPTSTPFGMAALLPGAETAFGCTLKAGELIPALGGKPTANVEDRIARFREHLGDRCADLRLDDLLEASDAELKRRVGRAALLVIRSEEIDNVGERLNPPLARRVVSSILDDLIMVAQRLVRAGVLRMIFAADHGFMMLREVLPGDKVSEPPGEWLLHKRRCRIGSAAGEAEGVRVLPAALLGMSGPVKDIALATGYRVFTDGSTYFHEGVSLQECVVPVVTLEARPVRSGSAPEADRVDILSRHARFTQRIFAVKLKLTSLLHAEADVRVLAMAPGEPRPVGQPTDCDALDPATGLVRLRVGEEEHVLIRIDDDFAGAEVEIRIQDAGGRGVLLGSKKLKNASLR